MGKTIDLGKDISAALIAKMSPETFKQFLKNTTDKHLKLIQNEGTAQALQHHLFILSHDLLLQIDQALKDIDQFLNRLDSIDNQEMSRREAKSLFQEVDAFRLGFNSLLQLSIKSLKIAWNTPRIDLINSISKAKNSCQKILYEEIGIPRSSWNDPTGMYEVVEKVLFSGFDNAIKDEDSAIEALLLLSSDYTKNKYRKKSLEKFKDLKLALVFSKKTLKEYMEE